MKKKQKNSIRKEILIEEFNRLKDLKFDIKIPNLLLSIKFSKQLSIDEISKITGLTKQRIYQICPRLLNSRERGKIKDLKIEIKPLSEYVPKKSKQKKHKK